MVNRTVSYQDRTTDSDRVVVSPTGGTPTPGNNVSPLVWLTTIGIVLALLFWLFGGFGQTTVVNVEPNPTVSASPSTNPSTSPSPSPTPSASPSPSPSTSPSPSPTI